LAVIFLSFEGGEMDWLTFITEIIKSIVWPVIILIIMVKLKQEFAQLISQLKHLKAGNVELDFDKEIKKIEDEADRAGLPPLSHDERKEEEKQKRTVLPNEIFLRVAKSDPQNAILETYKDFVILLKAYAIRFNISDQLNPHSIIIKLRRLNIISDSDVKIFKELYSLRNKVSNEKELNITKEQAREYRDLALRFIEQLKKMSN